MESLRYRKSKFSKAYRKWSNNFHVLKLKMHYITACRFILLTSFFFFFLFYYKVGDVQPHGLDLVHGLAFLPIVMFGKLL